MPRDVKIRAFRSTTANAKPPTTGGDGITAGELAANLADGLLFVGASNGGYITYRDETKSVWSVNGKTGDVVSVALTSGPQSFSGLQTFINGISGPSGFFSGTDNVLEIVASTNGRGIRISKSNDPNSSDSGIGYIQFGKYTTENRNWHLGSIGDRNFVFAQGNLGGTPTELLKWVFSGGYAGSGAWLIGSPAGTPYYLPDSDGTLGQIVYTDGSGNLYFDDPPVGGGGGSLTGFVLRSGDGLTSPIEANNTLTITGGVGIFTVKDGNDTVSVRGITATTSVLGVASFAANDFLVSSGAVSLTAGVVRSVNGLTGAVGLPLATTGASGVASFNSAHFTVSTTGHVSLASAPAGAGGTKTYEVFTALDNHPPVTDFAVFDTRGLTNTLGVLEFDGLVRKYATFVGKIPESASFNNLKVALDWCFAGTATEPEPSSIVWGVRWESLTTTSLDAESFSTGVTSGRVDTIGVVGGIPQSTTITCPYSSVDGLTAGLPFKLQVYRDAASLDDEAGPNLELFCVEVRGD